MTRMKSEPLCPSPLSSLGFVGNPFSSVNLVPALSQTHTLVLTVHRLTSTVWTPLSVGGTDVRVTWKREPPRSSQSRDITPHVTSPRPLVSLRRNVISLHPHSGLPPTPPSPPRRPSNEGERWVEGVGKDDAVETRRTPGGRCHGRSCPGPCYLHYGDPVSPGPDVQETPRVFLGTLDFPTVPRHVTPPGVLTRSRASLAPPTWVDQNRNTSTPG